MYWVGQILNLFVAGAGYFFLPKGKRMLGLVFFLVWFIWAFLGELIVGRDLSALGYAVINITSMIYFHKLWHSKDTT